MELNLGNTELVLDLPFFFFKFFFWLSYLLNAHNYHIYCPFLSKSFTPIRRYLKAETMALSAVDFLMVRSVNTLLLFLVDS